MDWIANWIWLGELPEQDDCYVNARKEFQLPGDIEEAYLHISANNRYKLYLNGSKIGAGPNRMDPDFPYYDTYDVMVKLKQDTNVIAVDAYCNINKGDRGRGWCLANGEPGFLVQLECNVGGEQIVITSDQTWKITLSPAWRPGTLRISRFQGFVEHFDADGAKQIEGYRSTGFDASNWSNAAELGVPPLGPVGNPIPREIPFLEPVEILPVKVSCQDIEGSSSKNETCHLGYYTDLQHEIIAKHSNLPVTITCDFGRTVGGYLHLELENCSGGHAAIFYGEDGKKLLHERIVLPKEGNFTFESYDWRGSQDVSLQFSDVPKTMILKKISFFDIQYPFKHTADFEADDPIMGQLWRMCRDTAHIATKDHPQDCVGREQALWLSDIVVHTRSSAVCFNDLLPMKKALRQVMRTMRQDGIVSVPGPVSKGYHYDDDKLPWSEQPLNIPISLEQIYKHTGDEAFIRESAEPIQRLMGHFAKYEDDRGLIQTNPEGLQNLVVFTGWAPMLKEGIPLNLNTEYMTALRSSAFIQDMAGEQDLARQYREKAERLKIKLFDLFYDREKHLFLDGELNEQLAKRYSSTANALAVAAGLLPESEYACWSQSIVTDPWVSEMRSPFDASNMLEAYFITGRDDLAAELIDSCWSNFVRKGNKTVPERWLEARNNDLFYSYQISSSKCHPYGTGPAYLFMNYVLGIQALEPGYKSVMISPQAMGLKLAKGRLQTPAGEFEVYWRRSDTEWYMEVIVPKGVEADVTLPRFKWGSGKMTCNGKIIWQTDSWERFKGDAYLFEQTDFTSKVTARLNSGQRNIIRMET